MNRQFSTPLALFRALQARVQESGESICSPASRARWPTGLGLRLALSLIGLLVLVASSARAETLALASATRASALVATAAEAGSGSPARVYGDEVSERTSDAKATGLNASAQDGPTPAVDRCGVITESTTWSPAVYVLTCPVYVNEGATLTIEAGAVVKFGPPSAGIWPSLGIFDGALVVAGTEAVPVVFTSYKDDVHGGDTNGDGSATTPGPGDWTAIELRGSADGTTGLVSHAWIGYGGATVGGYFRSMVQVSSQPHTVIDVLFQNVTFTQSSGTAFYACPSHATVRNSQFIDNARGVEGCSWGGSIIDARYNWWGYATGPNAPGNPLGEGDSVSEGVLYYPWVGDVSTYGLLPAYFRLTGPNTASPGEWADYTISYRSSPTKVIEDAVVVLTLPRTSDYVQSTGGGISWPERHQAFWKLGDLPPGTEGQLSATAEFVWGIPEGTSDGATAVLAGSNWQQNQLDVGAYLAYEPRELLGTTALTEGEFSAERAAYPDLDLVYTHAITDGFILAGVARLTISNHEPITQATLIHEERSEVMHIRRMSDTVHAATFGPESYAYGDAGGGMVLDFQMGTVSYWGTWGSSTQAADALAECSLTTSECFLNCVMGKAPQWLLQNISKAGQIALGSWACYRCFRGDEANCASCSVSLIPVVGEAVDVAQCLTDCDADPSRHVCIEERSWCHEGILNPFSFFSTENIVTLKCVDCKYQFPAVPTRVCAQNEKCRECPDGPVCLEESKCCGGTCPTSSGALGTCGSIQQAGDCCTVSQCDTDISTAHDPNAKYGVTGAVLPGQALTYTIEYENEGAGDAYGVFIVDPLDVGLDESTLSIYGGGRYLSSTRELMWDIGHLAPSGSPGSTGMVSFTVAVSEGLRSGTPIINEALVVFQSVPEETPTNAVVNVVQPVVALPQSVETSYMQAVSVTLEGVDVSGAPLTYTVAGEPLFGVLEGTPPLLTYTPMADFVGLDSFSFQASNGISSSLSARVQIRVQPSAADTTPPEVRWTSPEGGEVIEVVSSTPVFSDGLGLAYGPSILVQFTEAMSATTITTGTVQLTRGGGSPVPFSVSYEGWTNRAAIVLREPWRTSSYSVTLSTGIEDSSGNGLASEVVWGFGATAPEPSDRLYLPLLMKGASS